MKKYKIHFSVPELTGREVHVVTIEDDLEDTWSHVDILNEVYDLNVWQDDGPIEAALYPTSVTEEGCYTTDCSFSIAVVLHSIKRIGMLRSKELDLSETRR